MKKKELPEPRFTTPEEEEIIQSLRAEEARLFQLRRDAQNKHDHAVWALEDFRRILSGRGAVER